MRFQGATEYLLDVGGVVLLALIVVASIVGIGSLSGGVAEGEKQVIWRAVP